MNYRFLHGQRSIRGLDPSKSAMASRRLKNLYWKDGIRSCEFCGWSVPPGLFGFAVCLRVHHIIPLFVGGQLEDRLNTALLCPNHAAIADALAFQSLNRKGMFLGPKNRKDLFGALRKLEQGRNLPWLLTKATAVMEGLKTSEKA